MDRATKYSQAIKHYMQVAGHATNAELHAMLQQQFPDVSATTVHRITTRLVERGELLLAPSGSANVQRFDANLQPHDHFICQSCGQLRDAQLAKIIKPFIEQAIGNDCHISGQLTISGICKKCNREVSST